MAKIALKQSCKKTLEKTEQGYSLLGLRVCVLQEWFQHPAQMKGLQDAVNSEPVLSKVLVGGEENVELPQRHSFGFGVIEQEEHTSSDGEPGTVKQLF